MFVDVYRFVTARRMTLIEGVGDEVTDFFIVVGVLAVGWIAWCSTNIADQPLIRTVLILQHRTRTRIADFRVNSQTVVTTGRAQTMETADESPLETNDDTRDEIDASCPTPNESGDFPNNCNYYNLFFS